MTRGGGAKGRSPNFARLLHLDSRTAVGVLLGENSSVEVIFKKAVESPEVEQSNTPASRLSRHTVPTNMRLQMNEDDY